MYLLGGCTRCSHQNKNSKELLLIEFIAFVKERIQLITMESPVIPKDLSFRLKEKRSSRNLSREISKQDLPKTAIPAETDAKKRFAGTWESDSNEGMDVFLTEL